MFPNWSEIAQSILNFGEQVYDGASGGASSLYEAAERVVERGTQIAQGAQQSASRFIGRVAGRTAVVLHRMGEMLPEVYRPLQVDLRRFRPFVQPIWQEGSTFLPPTGPITQADIRDYAIAAAAGIVFGPLLPPLLVRHAVQRGLQEYAGNQRNIGKRINCNYSKATIHRVEYRRIAPMCQPREETLQCG